MLNSILRVLNVIFTLPKPPVFVLKINEMDNETNELLR